MRLRNHEYYYHWCVLLALRLIGTLVISSGNKWSRTAAFAYAIVAQGACFNSMHRRESNRHFWEVPWFIWFYVLGRVDHSMGDDDFNLDAQQWTLMSHCYSAARMIFP